MVQTDCETLVLEHSVLQPTLGYAPHSIRVPRQLHRALLKPDAAAAERLRGRCILVVGDSTMGEVTHDLAVVLGANSTRWLGSIDLAKYTLQTLTEPEQGLTGLFHHSNRNTTLLSTRHDAIVFYRYIGNADINQNYQGLRSLRSATLRAELLRASGAWCGRRPRELWLWSLYHDIWYTTYLSESERREHMRFLEALAPHRAWIGHHSTNFSRSSFHRGRKIITPYLFNVSAPEAWWRSEVVDLPGWRYVDYREAWGCETSALGEWTGGTDDLSHGQSAVPSELPFAAASSAQCAERRARGKLPEIVIPPHAYVHEAPWVSPKLLCHGHLSMLRTRLALTTSWNGDNESKAGAGNAPKQSQSVTGRIKEM